MGFPRPLVSHEFKMIESVIGITLWTNNLENMFYFYHRILEFPIHSKKNDFIAFQLGDIRFNIGNHGQITGSNKVPYRMMPHFEVADIHKVHERLSNLGVFWEILHYLGYFSEVLLIFCKIGE